MIGILGGVVKRREMREERKRLKREFSQKHPAATVMGVPVGIILLYAIYMLLPMKGT